MNALSRRRPLAASGQPLDVWSTLTALPRSFDKITPEHHPSIRFRPLPDIAGAVPTMLACVRFGETVVEVGLERTALGLLISRIEPAADLERLPSDLCHLAVEAVLAPWIEQVESRTGRRIEIETLVPFDDAAQRRRGPGLAIQIGNVETWLEVRAEPQVLSALGRWASSLPLARTTLDEAGVVASLRTGTTELTLAETATLRIGAGLVLDDAPADPLIAFAECLVARGVHEKGGVRLVSGPAPPEPAQRRWLMTQETSDQQTATRKTWGALEDMPVRLVAEVGRLTLPLSAVSDLGSGSILDFGAKTDAVSIYAGGVHLADGRLVRVDERTVVRIDRMAIR